MKKKKKIFLLLMGLILIIIIIVLIICLTKEKSYTKTYKAGGYEITEEYNSILKYYSFITKVDGKTFKNVITSKYIGKKPKINEVKVYSSGDYVCALLKSEDFDTYPSCYDNDAPVAYSLIDEDNFKEFYEVNNASFKNDTYKNITINTTLNKNFAIWNHLGFYYISSDSNKEIAFLENESYYNSLCYQMGSFILIPNYDEKYTFNTYYIIDLKSGSIKKWDLDYEINFNSYYLGDYDGQVYLVDRKEKKEYKINPKSKKIEIVTDKNDFGQVWREKWETVSMTKLVSTDYSFENAEVYSYSLNDNKLYLNYYKDKETILVTNRDVDKIIYASNDEVYYLSKDSLYSYSFKYGEILLMTYSEWNFNSDNSIYIY